MYFFILLQLRTKIISVRINKKSCYKPTFCRCEQEYNILSQYHSSLKINLTNNSGEMTNKLYTCVHLWNVGINN